MSAERAGQESGGPGAGPRSSPFSARATVLLSEHDFQTYDMGGLLWMTTKASSRSVYPQAICFPTWTVSVFIKWAELHIPSTATKEWLWKSFSHQMPLAVTLSGTVNGDGGGGEQGLKSQYFLHCSPLAGNVTVAIPQQLLCARIQRATPPNQPLSSDISCGPEGPRLAHPSPELLKRVCPEGEMHGFRQEGAERSF